MTMEASKHNFCADRTCRIVSQEGKLSASNSSCPKFAAILYDEKVYTVSVFILGIVIRYIYWLICILFNAKIKVSE